MTPRHIIGLMGCMLALLICAMLKTCGDHTNDVKEVVLVIAGGIIGDANSITKYRTRYRTGPHRTLEPGGDGR